MPHLMHGDEQEIASKGGRCSENKKHHDRTSPAPPLLTGTTVVPSMTGLRCGEMACSSPRVQCLELTTSRPRSDVQNGCPVLMVLTQLGVGSEPSLHSHVPTSRRAELPG